MPSMRLNIEAHQGDDETYTFTVKNKQNVVVDLTGVTAISGTIRDKIGGTSIGVMTHNVTDSDLPNGVVAVDLASAVTLLMPNISHYDIQYTSSSGQKKTLVHGLIETTSQITTS